MVCSPLFLRIAVHAIHFRDPKQIQACLNNTHCFLPHLLLIVLTERN